MTRNEILTSVNEIFIETMDNKDIVLEEKTQAADVDEWDSIIHILLVVAIEKKFNIRFASNEIQNWKDIGEIIDSISSKI
ncbi:acyl carrier protein [Maribacter luteus]|uniref:Acyl carrier protein n=1 Tax=Maribacter luteus TaxID=2594478 RepID=A0A6I2MLS2_9FLAO|nr:acyl carrier protein [Maribacter luteus]MRX63747.1 acyl carrier protein [Maribacter luteus]|tara:strand:- start:1967 stop:2206 length:240 start_codon:yes stop_codon:yes gene_type:complete